MRTAEKADIKLATLLKSLAAYPTVLCIKRYERT